MITRPLDLASRLRLPPAGPGTLFYVNVGLLAVFFALFGSRFVLSPGLGTEFSLPKVASGAISASLTDLVVAVPASDMAVVDGAVLTFKGLAEWLRARGAEAPGRRLLVQAAANLTVAEAARLQSMAAEAGLGGVVFAADRTAD